MQLVEFGVELVSADKGSPMKLWVEPRGICESTIHPHHPPSITAMCESRHSVVRYLDFFFKEGRNLKFHVNAPNF